MPNKTVINLLMLALMPVAANAQFGNMSEAQMQQMMQQGLKMQQCFSQIDQAAMERLSERGQAIEAEITALCQAGERDQAEEKAISFAREMAGDPAVQTMKKCGEGMIDLLPKIVAEQDDNERGEGSRSRHICDNQ